MRAPLLLLLASVVATLATAAAQAASVDCARAVTAREQLICADPKLGSADDAVAAAYRAALAPLSAAARAVLRDGQRRWLAFLDTLCDTGGRAIPGAASAGDTPAACLERRYGVRQRQLDHATFVAGGRVLARVESFSARPSGDRYRFIERDIAYPQIDQPRGAAERHWNAAIRRQIETAAKAPGAPRDQYLDYRIAAASDRLISTVITDYTYPHGAAHGGEVPIAANWLLREGRALKAGDLFDPAKPWRDTLAQLAFVQLQRQVAPNELFVNSAGQIRDAVGKPERWAIERDGLGILFQEYEVGPYVLGHPEVVVPWAALTPVLAPHPAFAVPPV